MITPQILELTALMGKRWRACQKVETSVDVAFQEIAQSNRELIPYDPGEFESDTQRLLDTCFPFSCLAGVQVFSPRRRGEGDLGTEIDHLLHFKMGGTDYLVLVEVKRQPIEISEKGWRVSYLNDNGEVISKKCTKDQVNRQIRTLWDYLRPISPRIDLAFLGLVVSIDTDTPRASSPGLYSSSSLELFAVDQLIPHLVKFFNLDGSGDGPAGVRLMVSQSPFLSLLRLSRSLEPLGHPELKSAISYVDRCRRSLDESIYKDFDPTRGHWAINGSAGMGKSVLLAYTAAVLCSGYRLHELKTGENYVGPAKDTFGKIGFKDDKKLSVGILAMSTKQLDSLRFWFQFFVECFQEKDEVGQITFRKPDFILVRTLGELQRKSWSALLVDECHDIQPAAERALVDAYQKQGFFLVVACDRHQKLRFTSDDSRILNGLDFGRHTRRLKKTYRNPAPISIASFALMFRWFAKGGLKVIPTKEQMIEQFGFSVEGERSTGYTLRIQTDAHPGNTWSHTVASFPDAGTAFMHLQDAHLAQNEVLWVRFSDEDQDFNYEDLGRKYVYHVCRALDAYKISDKYIKGQDYPVVVIEGFPGFMDRFDGPDQEEKMWSFRRELYLCASRATCFLYFVVNVPETSEALRIRKEIQDLVSALSVPVNYGKGGTKKWEFLLVPPEINRSMEVFKDQEIESTLTDIEDRVETVEMAASADESVDQVKGVNPHQPSVPDETDSEAWELWVHGPITVSEFAAKVAAQSFQVQDLLRTLGIHAETNTLIEIDALETIALNYGWKLRIYQVEVLLDDTVEDSSSNKGLVKCDFSDLDEWLNREARPAIAMEEIPARATVAHGESLATIVNRKILAASRGKESIAESPSQDLGKRPSFFLGRRTFVYEGGWIEDSEHGVGCILKLNTRAGYADSHRVWFARSGSIFSNQPLRGRVTRIIPDAKIAEEVKMRCPLIPDAVAHQPHGN